MNRYFETFDAALRSWGRYERDPYRLEAAAEALQLMIAARGYPVGFDGCPYYVVESEQYVAVTWPVPSGTRVSLLFNAGFIDSLVRLSPDWQLVPVKGLGGEVVDWWRLTFPNHVSSLKAGRTSPVLKGFCPCSPGLQQAVGQPCERCEEVVQRGSLPVA